MVCLGNHKFGATGVQGWNGKKRGPKGDINRIQRTLNALLRSFEFILRGMKIQGEVKSSNLIMPFPAFEL